MNTEAFLKAYRESRNGTDSFHFSPLYRQFLYSDGVKECAEAGCYWLLDILGTELPAVFKQSSNRSSRMYIEVRVTGTKAKIIGTFPSEQGSAYIRDIDYTDMPEGIWDLIVGEDEGDKLLCILVTEH